MGTIFYGCDECMRFDPEAAVHERGGVRLANDGKMGMRELL